jgi:hypothetical protein
VIDAAHPRPDSITVIFTPTAPKLVKPVVREPVAVVASEPVIIGPHHAAYEGPPAPDCAPFERDLTLRAPDTAPAWARGE